MQVIFGSTPRAFPLLRFVCYDFELTGFHIFHNSTIPYCFQHFVRLTGYNQKLQNTFKNTPTSNFHTQFPHPTNFYHLRNFPTFQEPTSMSKAFPSPPKSIRHHAGTWNLHQKDATHRHGRPQSAGRNQKRRTNPNSLVPAMSGPKKQM